MDMSLTPQERAEVFGTDDPGRYADEARQRWGGTEAYQQSAGRTAGYDKADWQRITSAGEDLERRMVAAMRAGTDPGSPEAVELAEEHRLHIERSFYDCPPAMHRGLADMYLADDRFTAHYEQVAPGLARFVHDAIHANADRRPG
jgi:hypothetical protein